MRSIMILNAKGGSGKSTLSSLLQKFFEPEKGEIIVNKKNLSEVGHWSQGLKKIIAKRTDIYVEVERTVLRALKTDEFKNENIKIAGVMEKVDLYTFLNKKYANLVPQLAAILKEMKKDGTIKNFMDTVENTAN